MNNLRKIVIFVVVIAFFTLVVSNDAYAIDQPISTRYTIYGTANVGEGLITGWTKNSEFNGVNAWNDIDNSVPAFLGAYSISWQASAALERAWLVSPNPIDISLYQYINFYARAQQPNQQYEVAFVNTAGEAQGTWVRIDTGGGPIPSDRWQSYSLPISAFGITGGVNGIGFRESSGGKNLKVFFDEIILTSSANGSAQTAPPQTISPSEPPKPTGPYYPEISPWVFIIPAIIIMAAIFFE